MVMRTKHGRLSYFAPLGNGGRGALPASLSPQRGERLRVRGDSAHGLRVCGNRSVMATPHPGPLPSEGRGRKSSDAGFFNIELAVAIAILAVVMLPLGGAWYHETKMLRAYYRDAVAMEILDGEMEVLAAGEWRSFPEGRHELKPAAHAATNLPPGRFILTRETQRVSVEWRPERGRKMAREVRLP